MVAAARKTLEEIREQQLIERYALDRFGMSGRADMLPLDFRKLVADVADLKQQVEALTAAKRR
jgi:hypothetical protein